MRQLEAKSVKELHKQEFEDFCERLLHEEKRRLFGPDAIRIYPPSEEDWADGSRDIQVVVHDPPREESHESLLPHRRCTIWYSCKSKRGDGWQAQVREAVDPSPRLVDANTGDLVADADNRLCNPDKRKRLPPRRLLTTLASGGEFVVLVNVNPGAGALEKIEHELCTLFSFLITKELEREVPAQLARRVRVLGATEIARAYNAAPFTPKLEIREKLGLDEPAFWSDWNRWTEQFSRQRKLLDYRTDPERAKILSDIEQFLTTSTVDDPVIRIWGAPGVGKTRLIHHALEQHFENNSDGLARVRYTDNSRELQLWLGRDDGDLRDLVLVIDEVLPSQAGMLADSFALRAGVPTRARLLMIGPKQSGLYPKPTAIELGPLHSNEIRKIIEREIGEGEAADIIERLSEGFPLHALWLSKALVDSPALLRAPRQLLTGGEDPWLATSAVLAGPQGDDLDPWRREAELRGKALLLAVLAPDDDWRGFEDTLEAELAKLLRVNWSELLDAATACIERGLLRVVGRNRRYISPANLERLILNHFFDDGPAGPPLDPRRLRERIPERYPRLLERARIVGASDACRRTLTGSVVDALGESRDPARLQTVTPSLEETIRFAPEQAAHGLRALIQSLGPRSTADPLVRAALQQLSHRRLSRGGFEAVEDGLWMLATVGYAERSWAELFARVHATHQQFELRFELLERRLRAPTPAHRKLALQGLAALLDHDVCVGHVAGRDDLESTRAQPKTDVEVHQQINAGWRALLRVAEDQDEDPSVATAARAMFCQLELDSAPTGANPDVIERLTALVGQWTSEERNALREALWGPESPLEDVGGVGEDKYAAVAELGRALAPHDLDDQLVAQVGSWMPTFWAEEHPAVRGESVAGDRELAEQLIEQPEFVVEQLPWLGSDRAVRAAQFGKVVGRLDEDRVLLPVLLDHDGPSLAPRFVAGYLAGWGHGPDGEALDDWITARLTDATHAQLLAHTLIESSGSDRRARLLLELLDRRTLSDDSLLRLGYSEWAASVSIPCIDELIITLARRSNEAKLQALGLADRRFERSVSSISEELRLTIGQLVAATASGRLPALAEAAWSHLVRRLSVVGDLTPLERALEAAASTHFIGYPHHLVKTLRHLLDAAQVQAVWDVVHHALENGCRARAMRDFLEHAGVFDELPAELMMNWVGDDAARGAEIAWFVRVRSPELNPLGVQLVRRFGPDASPARILHDRIVAASRGDTSRTRSEHAEQVHAWQEGYGEDVAAWAANIEHELSALAERERQDDDHERRYYG